MTKRLFLIILFLTFIIGCSCQRIHQKDGKNRFYLEDKYYHQGEFVRINSNDLNELKSESYILYTYNSFCVLSISCEDIFQEFMRKYQIDFVSIPFNDFKNTDFYEEVKYAPSIIIVQKGKIVSYLDANSNNDLSKYQDVSEFEKWLDNYIYFSNK